jgi:hypothetical protein
VSSIEHQMTEIYCFVDDYLRAHPSWSMIEMGSELTFWREPEESLRVD